MSKIGKLYRESSGLRRVWVTVVALCAALAVGAIVLLVTGKNVLQAYEALWAGAFGSGQAFSATLITTTPLLIMGLGVSVAFSSGYFNIGAGGQMALGALAAAVVGTLNIPGPLSIALMILAGAGAGAFWGFIPGYLRAYRGANEIVTTLMMNYVALFLLDYLVTGPLHDAANGTRTPDIKPGARFPELFGAGNPTIALILALVAVPLTSFLLRRTSLGFELRMVGMNPDAGFASGMSPKRVAVTSLTLSGLYSGIAGACLVGGVFWSVSQGFNIQLGFDAIAVALLGALNPWGILAASILWGGVLNGSQTMQLNAGVSQPFTLLIEALVLIALVLVPWVMKALLVRSSKRMHSVHVDSIRELGTS